MPRISQGDESVLATMTRARCTAELGLRYFKPARRLMPALITEHRTLIFMSTRSSKPKVRPEGGQVVFSTASLLKSRLTPIDEGPTHCPGRGVSALSRLLKTARTTRSRQGRPGRFGMSRRSTPNISRQMDEILHSASSRRWSSSWRGLPSIGSTAQLRENIKLELDQRVEEESARRFRKTARKLSIRLYKHVSHR